jgi:hypothetical protein
LATLWLSHVDRLGAQIRLRFTRLEISAPSVGASGKCLFKQTQQCSIGNAIHGHTRVTLKSHDR